MMRSDGVDNRLFLLLMTGNSVIGVVAFERLRASYRRGSAFDAA
jgi:hypothetical protein